MKSGHCGCVISKEAPMKWLHWMWRQFKVGEQERQLPTRVDMPTVVLRTSYLLYNQLCALISLHPWMFHSDWISTQIALCALHCHLHCIMLPLQLHCTTGLHCVASCGLHYLNWIALCATCCRQAFRVLNWCAPLALLMFWCRMAKCISMHCVFPA